MLSVDMQSVDISFHITCKRSYTADFHPKFFYSCEVALHSLICRRVARNLQWAGLCTGAVSGGNRGSGGKAAGGLVACFDEIILGLF